MYVAISLFLLIYLTQCQPIILLLLQVVYLKNSASAIAFLVKNFGGINFNLLLNLIKQRSHNSLTYHHNPLENIFTD